MSKVKLALLYGGPSGEHEISLRSSASVLANLDADLYEIIPVAIDKQGACFLNNYQECLEYTDSLPVETGSSKLIPSLIKNGRFFIDADVVFPVVHGPLCEDGCLQGLLELSGVAFVGSPTVASAIAMDKELTRRIVCGEYIKSAPSRTYTWKNDEKDLQRFCNEVTRTLKWPLFVKPCAMGSSVGIYKTNNMDELVHAINAARRFDRYIIVEQEVVGREIELAVLETDPNLEPLVSQPGEIKVKHGDGFYSYAAKYVDENTTDLVVPAVLDVQIVEKLKKAAIEIFTSIKCRGLARVDFFVDEAKGDIYFNEINTLPGFTSISMYPRLWQEEGVSYSELLTCLINVAIAHQKQDLRLVREYNI